MNALPLANRHAAERERLEMMFRRYLKIAFDKPTVTTGTFLENGSPSGRVLVATEENRKSVQVLPDKPDPRRGQGW
jgi:hypothetical protein